MNAFRRTLCALAVVLCATCVFADDDAQYSHVLLISIDGMHARDLAWLVANHPDAALAQLSEHGRTYTNAVCTRPSDSFPGLLAIVTGGTSKSTGVFYDDGYDRTLANASGPCVAGAHVVWKQNLDFLPFSFTTTINPANLPRTVESNCADRVYPHQFPRVNNIFEIVKAAGGRTAWSDKHPAYEFLNGPSGTGVDDLYTPEITSPTTPQTTNNFVLTMAYDDIKRDAILREIHGFDHTGANFVGVPTVFGMNFQAVSVGQKLRESSARVGGYVSQTLVPTDRLAETILHTDTSIGAFVDALSSEGLLDSTLMIITAKHGNSPIDPDTLVRVDPAKINTAVNSVQSGLAALVSADTGPLIWLTDSSKTQQAVDAILADPAIRADRVIYGDELAAMYGGDNAAARVPDIIIVPTPGTVYTTSGTKIADHGGFNEDDVHVALLVANPSLPKKTINDPVETRQIACTILKALALDCQALESEALEPSKFLPNSNHKNR